MNQQAYTFVFDCEDEALESLRPELLNLAREELHNLGYTPDETTEFEPQYFIAEISVRLVRRGAWRNAASFYGAFHQKETGGMVVGMGEYYQTIVADYHLDRKWEKMPEADKAEAARLFYEGMTNADMISKKREQNNV